MTLPDAGAVLAEAAVLVEARVPFVMATVVWRKAPSSGRMGGRAIILGDGTVRGWIGGACAEPTVLAVAQRCLETAEPELLLLGGDHAADRVRAELSPVAMACESDGGLEVFMDPVVPSLRVVVVGRSPAVDALAGMATALGWDARVVDDGGRADEHRSPEIVHTKLDLATLVPDARTAVVVATQGHYDDLALAAALATPAGYIGLVASAVRAEAVLDQLRADGHDEDQLARIVAPAGLDLGSVGNAEIAAAVLAQIVARRAAGAFDRTQEPAVRPAPLATDPICGMTVDPGTARYHSLHDGVDYWFCASGCKRAFDADPGAAQTAPASE